MPQHDIPLINGQAYSWADVTVLLNGTRVIGITAIDYEDKVVKENGYGAGRMPIERSSGKYTATCNITLKAAELEALAAKAPNGRLQDYGVFDIIVNYLVGSVRTTHRIRNCEFTNNARNIKQETQALKGS